MPTTLPAKLDRDTFLVNQKHRAWMKSKYYVFDADGQPLLYVERPVRPLRRSDITIFDDDTRTTPLLIIRQDHGYAALARTYTLLQPGSEEPVARFRRDNIKSLFRRAWTITDPSGSVIANAREDSAAIAVVRRILEFVPYVGALVGLVRTNFQLSVVAPDGAETHVGAFNRKLSIGDKYVLDLTADPSRMLDRRIALALGILLDTGEAR
jgi:hypothetical protein